ncbi:MAG: hypothetical protein IJM63_04510 [Solobacterium sp.]|nr:hypothetical protein [Solobacterium sp.]
MFDFVLDAVMKYTPLESWDVSTDSLLREDLKMDRSDIFLLKNELEKMFESEISDEEMENTRSVMDVLKLAEKFAKM